MSDSWILEVILVPIGTAAIVAYNVSFYYRVKTRPLTTVVGVNNFSRKAWVYSIMKDIDKKNILAVQTLRNSIMASTLLASTAILLAAAMATFVASSTNAMLQTSINSIYLGSHSLALLTVKYFMILLCFIFSFMCHVQSIRYTNHVNFLITVPVGPEHPGLTPEYVSSVLARGSNFYTIGTRGFYFAIPYLLWLFGPIPMAAGALLMVPALYHLDTAMGYVSESRRTCSDPNDLESRGSEGAGSRMHAGDPSEHKRLGSDKAKDDHEKGDLLNGDDSSAQSLESKQRLDNLGFD